MSTRVFITSPRSESYARPQPDPLPQERGGYSPVFSGLEGSGFSLGLETNHMKAETGTVAREFFRGAKSFSLSPGERAGVRASVTTISFGKEFLDA